MSFDQAQMTYVHLVSWPSIWLPPARTHKVLMLGFQENELQSVAQMLSNSFGDTNWAIYYVPDCDVHNQEHLDWLIINSHIDHVILNSNDVNSLFLALLLNRSHTFCVCQSILAERAAALADWHLVNFEQAFSSILFNNQSKGSDL